jgi:hypothetical protein
VRTKYFLKTFSKTFKNILCANGSALLNSHLITRYMAAKKKAVKKTVKKAVKKMVKKTVKKAVKKVAKKKVAKRK